MAIGEAGRSWDSAAGLGQAGRESEASRPDHMRDVAQLVDQIFSVQLVANSNLVVPSKRWQVNGAISAADYYGIRGNVAEPEYAAILKIVGR